MKLLVISDAPDQGLWDYFSKEKLQGADAIISCGDLPSSYLTFLVTMANKPLFYVHGNHDTRYEQQPPEGCDCIDGKVIEFKGYRILGLGGCMKYNSSVHQYTERQMRWRIAKLGRSLRRGGVDILITHAPAQGVGDMEDACHRGFACFKEPPLVLPTDVSLTMSYLQGGSWISLRDPGVRKRTQWIKALPEQA